MIARAMGRTRYTPQQKADALDLYAAHGPAEAERRTGIPKGTIASWASRAGLATVAADVTRAATEVSAARRHYVAEEFRTQMIETLADIATKAAAKELAILANEHPSLDKVVGARTRAIHDLQLLTGAATGRTETIERTPEVEAELAKVLQMRRRSA